MKITEVIIDGFRNIKNTRLDLSVEPIAVLLAPNNSGKSNLLLAIQNGFDLIAKQGTQAVKYIQDSDNYANWNINENDEKKIACFTFGVRFIKNDKPNCSYHYQYSLKYEVFKEKLTDRNEETVLVVRSKPCGIDKEILSVTTISDNNLTLLFWRTASGQLDVDDVAHLPGNRDVTIPRDEGVSKYPCYYLALHKLGNTAVFFEETKETKNILKDISGALTSLTRANIGDIIADEKSDFTTHGVLTQDAIKIMKQDKEETNQTVFPYFISKFKTLFPFYNTNNGVELIPLGNSGQYQLLFHDVRNMHKYKQETAKTLSFGTRRVFKILSQIIANETPLVSIEEIEIGLHPELYTSVVEIFAEVLKNEKFTIETNRNRKNDPRVIVSSHAPGIVNAFVKIEDGEITEDHLDAIYIAVPDLESTGNMQFARLNNDKGKPRILKSIKTTYFRAGDIIFALFSEEYLREGNLTLLDIPETIKWEC